MTDKIKIHIWHTGMVLVDTAVPFRHTAAWPMGLGRGRKHKILLPVSSYLIQHPKGNILIDTGWSEVVRDGQTRQLGLTRLASKPSLPANWSVKEHLRRVNMNVADIDFVLLTHLDTDHVSGLLDVKNARSIITSNVELVAAQKSSLRYRKTLWKGLNIQPFQYQVSGIGPLGKSYDLFNDGTVQIVDTPGHTAGLSSVLVTGSNDNFVLLASDVGYDEKNINENFLPGILTSIEEEMNSLSWIREMSNLPNCQGIIFNHDIKIVEQEMII